MSESTSESPLPNATASAATRVEKTVAVSPGSLVKAISSPYGLGTWFGDEAWSEKREGGRVVIRWHNGRQLAGRWTEFHADGPITCTLLEEQGEASRVSFQLAREDGASLAPDETAETLVALAGGPTDLTVTVDGPLAAADWQQMVDDLVAYAETGINARLGRRPMMGVYPDFPDRDLAEPMGMPLGGVVEGGGAQAAGLVQGDVVTGIADRQISDWPSLTTALDGLRAGEVVPVTFLRNGETRTVDLTLGGRDLPSLPESTESLAAALTSSADEILERIAAVMASTPESKLATAPAQGEWNASQVLAHLIISERYAQLDLAARVGDVPGPEWAESGELVLQTALAERSVSDLLETLADALRSNADLGTRIVAADPEPSLLVAVAGYLDHCRDHGLDHVAQIEAIASTS